MTEMTPMQCGECGIEFHVPETWRAEKKQTGRGWYCPNGHSRVYKESDVDAMRRERDKAVQEQARLAEEVAVKEKEVARLKKRSSAGVCPCCTRTFTNMARHMKTKHPELLASNVVKLKSKAAQR